MSDALIRIEYKLDLILQALMDQGIMVPDLPRISGIEMDDCPVCGEQISVVPHYETESLRYVCGCELPKSIVPGISGILISKDTDDGSSRTPEDPEVLQSETDRRSDG